MKKLARYLLLLAAMVMGFAFVSCKADDDDDTSQPPAYYTVTFNSNGGTEVKSQKVESGKKATKPADPTKQAIATETYAFENWYTSTDNGTTLSDTAFDFNTPITKDITLYAKWAVNAVTHTVTFDTKGGSDVASQTIVHGKKAAKPTNPTKAATEAETYIFDNWYTSTDRGETLSETAFDFNTAITKDITLYAKWTVNAVTHTVTFDTKGGSTSPAEQTIVHGKKATKPADPKKQATETETYAFDNWYTSTDGGTSLSDTAFDFDTAIDKDITLYAKWTATAITHTVTFNTNGGSTAPAEQTIIHGNKATRPTDPTKEETATEAFVFDNWYTSTDGGTTLSDTAFNFDTEITEDIKLYAKWNTKALYKVSYTTEYGTTPSTITVEENTVLTENQLPELKNDDYIFCGWYDGETKAIAGTYKVTKPVTLTAMWGVGAEIPMKKCSVINSIFRSIGQNATHFAKANTKPENADYHLDAAEKYIPLWYDDNSTTLYYYIEPGKRMSLRATYHNNSLFSNMDKLESIDTSDFDTSKVTDMTWMFSGCKALTKLDLSSFDTSNVTDMRCMFQHCEALTKLDLSSFNTNKVSTMFSMFAYCYALTKLDVSSFDTSNVTDMSYMFEYCKSLTKLDLSNFNKSMVTNMSCMFQHCEALTKLDLTNFDTSNVTDMSCMFEYCKSLTKLDLSSFDTSKVTNMNSMFRKCVALTELNLSSFNTNKVSTMFSMFVYCEALAKLDLNNFDTSNVTDMDNMFSECYALTELDLSSFNTSMVTEMMRMFKRSIALTTIYVSDSFVTDNVTKSENMFDNCPKLIGGDGTKYAYNHVDKEYARIDGGTENPGYFTAKE